MHQAVVVYLAHCKDKAHAKTKASGSEVSGGGKKTLETKGTRHCKIRLNAVRHYGLAAARFTDQNRPTCTILKLPKKVESISASKSALSIRTFKNSNIARSRRLPHFDSNQDTKQMAQMF